MTGVGASGFKSRYTDRIDARIDAGRLMDRLFVRLSDMEAAVVVLMTAGWSEAEIARHFELDAGTVRALFARVRRKAKVMSGMSGPLPLFASEGGYTHDYDVAA